MKRKFSIILFLSSLALILIFNSQPSNISLQPIFPFTSHGGG